MPWLILIAVIPYLVTILRIYTGLRQAKTVTKVNSLPDQKIKISVVVACRNESRHINNLLQSLAAQTYDKSRFEVIICDDNSSDDTFAIASGFKGIANLKVVKNNGKGKKLALRTAISVAANDIIVATDADCNFDKNWLSVIADTVSALHPDMILLPVRFRHEDRFFNQIQQVEFLSLQGITAGTAMLHRPVMCNGAGLVFQKDAYLRNSSKLHDELNTGDDVFLLYALKHEKKSKIIWLGYEDAIVTTEASADLAQFVKQRSRWASKAASISDKDTLVLGIVTFVTIFAQLFLIAAAVVNLIWLFPLIIFTLIKALPDFLLISETAKQYQIKGIMRWYPFAVLIYPFYVLVIIVSVLLRGGSISSPSPKGI